MPSVAVRQNAQSVLQSAIDRIVGSPASPFFAPGVVVTVARNGQVIEQIVAGVDADGVALQANSLFPLASASKLAPGIALLRLEESGHISFDDPLRRYLPEALAAVPGLTLRSLLSHISGLPLEVSAERLPYHADLDFESVAQACLDTPLAHPPGTHVQYSNVAYGLLALVIERVTKLDYRTAIERLVVEPLGIEAYVGHPGPRPHAKIGGIDSAFVGTEMEPFNSTFSQNLLLPWSSIYSTAEGLLALLEVYAGRRQDLVSAEGAAISRSDQTTGLAGGFKTAIPFIGFNSSKSIEWPSCSWGLAVELRGDKRPHWAPAAAGGTSFGQIGSSGCLVWCDAARRMSWAIVGTRTTDSGWILRHGGGLGTLALQLGNVDV